MMRGRADQRGEGPFDQVALNCPDPDKRVRHRRSTGVEPIGRRRCRLRGLLIAEALVEAAAEGSRMSGRRAHAGLAAD